MTRLLLDWLGKLRGPFLDQLLASSLILVALPMAMWIDIVRDTYRNLRAAQVLLSTQTSCPRGHVVKLRGAWQCPSCNLVSEGHAFSECPHCGDATHAVLCACGLPAVNPLSPVRR